MYQVLWRKRRWLLSCVQEGKTPDMYIYMCVCVLFFPMNLSKIGISSSKLGKYMTNKIPNLLQLPSKLWTLTQFLATIFALHNDQYLHLGFIHIIAAKFPFFLKAFPSNGDNHFHWFHFLLLEINKWKDLSIKRYIYRSNHHQRRVTML